MIEAIGLNIINVSNDPNAKTRNKENIGPRIGFKKHIFGIKCFPLFLGFSYNRIFIIEKNPQQRYPYFRSPKGSRFVKISRVCYFESLRGLKIVEFNQNFFTRSPKNAACVVEKYPKVLWNDDKVVSLLSYFTVANAMITKVRFFNCTSESKCCRTRLKIIFSAWPREKPYFFQKFFQAQNQNWSFFKHLNFRAKNQNWIITIWIFAPLKFSNLLLRLFSFKSLNFSSQKLRLKYSFSKYILEFSRMCAFRFFRFWSFIQTISVNPWQVQLYHLLGFQCHWKT